MNWFTADYHLSHKNIIGYCNRPFTNVEEMNATILNNLEHKVKQGDKLYFLGDLSFKKDTALMFFKKFSDIEIHFVIGNHDHTDVIKLAENYCDSVSRLEDIQIEDQPITVCHYAMRVWNKSIFNAWQLHGHSHGTLVPFRNQYDIGIDNNNFYPVSYRELLPFLNVKKNNIANKTFEKK